MKKLLVIVAGMLMAFSLLFAFSSCSKKDDAAKGTAKKEDIKPTPEQERQMEAIKKGVEESQRIVIARVNGAEITMYQLVKEMNAVLPRFVPQGQQVTPEITAKVKKKSLDNLIFKELAVQEAVREGFKVKPETIEDVVRKVKAQAGSDEDYKKYLAERNLDENGLRKAVEKSHLYEGITAREIFDKIKVDEKTLRGRYEKDKAFFMTKDKPPKQVPFEEVRDLIERKIKAERGAPMVAAWDNSLRKKAKIEVMLDEVEKKLQEDAAKLKK